MKIEPEMLWKDGKSRALTFSYDDGTIHDRKLIDCMNRYGIRGTFNLNSGLFGRKGMEVINGIETDFSRVEEAEVKALYEGHEVASHTFTHPSLKNIPTEMRQVEVVEDQEKLERLTGRKVTGFAYPYGDYTQEIEQLLSDCGLCYGRTVCSTGNFELPDDFMEWHPTCHHEDPRLMELAEKFCREDTAAARVFYIWGHSYEFAQKDNWQLIEELFQYMKQYADQIWFATNGEIADYVEAYRSLGVSSDGEVLHNPTDQELWYSYGREICCIQPGERREL